MYIGKIDFINLAKKRGDFSLPPSPHKIKLNDSFKFYEHLLVENDVY